MSKIDVAKAVAETFTDSAKPAEASPFRIAQVELNNASCSVIRIPCPPMRQANARPR